MTVRTWHGPTPFLRLREEDELVIPEVPMIFLHVRRPKGRTRWLHTNWAGRICRFRKVDDAHRPKQGKKYERFGTHVPFNPRASYEGWLCGEIFFDRGELKEEQLKPLDTSVENGRFYIDWEAPAPTFRSFETTLLRFLTRGSVPPRLEKLGEALGAGITGEDYATYQELLASLLQIRLLDRYLRHQPRELPRDFCGGKGVLPRLGRRNPTGWLHATADPPGEIWIARGADFDREIRDAFVYTGTADLAQLKTGRPTTGSDGFEHEEQDITSRAQIWKLDATVKPRPGLGYDAADHAALARDLSARIARATADRATRLGLSEAEAAFQILTDRTVPGDKAWAHRNLLSPSLSGGDHVSRVPAPALESSILVGQSQHSFDAAFAHALSLMDAPTRTQAEQDDLSRKGKSKETGWVEVERPLASMVFPFATGHWIYDFQLVHIRRRVEAWWKTVPAEVRRRLGGGVIRVDAWASQLGDRDFNNWLSDRRMDQVMDALRAVLDSSGVADVELRGVSHGEAASSDIPRADILRAVEVFESTPVYDAMIHANQDNPWNHRVVTLELCERTKVPAAGESQVLSSKVLTETSYPLVQATALAGVARRRSPNVTSKAQGRSLRLEMELPTQEGHWDYWVWVLVTPGEEIEPRSTP